MNISRHDVIQTVLLMPRYGQTLVVVALLAGGLVAGCGKKAADKPAASGLPTVRVRALVVEPQRRIATEELVGTVRSRQTASLSAKVSGTIQEMTAVPGLVVTQGQVLVVIDAKEIQARLEQAQAVREQAGRELERFRKLLEGQAVTPQEFDAVQSRYRVAEASVKEAETMLSYVRVSAPFDGVVSAKRAEVGDLAAPGRPLVEVEDPKTLRIEVDVPETLIDRVKLSDRLLARAGPGGREVPGTVSEIAPAADPATRTFRVKLDLGPEAGLRSGQFARVSVPVAEMNALRIPAAAVVERGQMELVFVAEGGRARMRLVKTGKRLGDEVEVVSGLNAGETLVWTTGPGLVDGQPVELSK